MEKYWAVGTIGFLIICFCILISCVDVRVDVAETVSGMPCDMYEDQTDGSVEVVINEIKPMRVLGKKETKKDSQIVRVREVPTASVDIPTEIVEIPTEIVEIPTEAVVETVIPVTESVIPVVETTVNQVTEAPVEVIETTIDVIETPASDGFVMKSVNGLTMNGDWQRYLYDNLCARGIGWYFDIALCQLYQESHYNPTVIGSNGLDSGIGQICSTYWGSLCHEAGLPNGNILDPYNNIYIYAFLMGRYLNAHGGDVNWGLSAYFTGNTAYAPGYIQEVMQWIGTVTVY